MQSNPVKIGISGLEGSFSDQAGLEFAKQADLKNYLFDYLISVDAVLEALTRQKIELGIFPIENSNGGVVLEAVYAMSKYIFKVKEMFEIPVSHNLLSQEKINLDQIETIVSHNQAISQCKMYLRRKLPNASIIEAADTALAAKDLASGKYSKKSAVIASKKAAQIWNLNLIDKNIQDLKFNFTTFLAVER